MKKVIILLVVFVLVLSSALPVHAAGGKVTYDGNAREFFFEPGSGHSPTDLFPKFKDVMPGDTLTQKITVKNDASNKVKVMIYMRALGAHQDSEAFLSQLHMTVQQSADSKMAYMFDATANETAGLTDWVCLGTLYSGGQVELDVTLTVPVQLDNAFQDQVGYLDWEFMVQELPIEDEDPKPPQTGDDSKLGLWISVMGGSLLLILILFIWRKKEWEKKENKAVKN